MSKEKTFRAWAVPARLTLQGTLIVSARSQEEAYQVANLVASYDDDFLARAEWVDWGPEGSPREEK